jgi:hypothetical protein
MLAALDRRRSMGPTDSEQMIPSFISAAKYLVARTSGDTKRIRAVAVGAGGVGMLYLAVLDRRPGSVDRHGPTGWIEFDCRVGKPRGRGLQPPSRFVC